MSGRDIFRAVKPIVNGVSAVFSVLPRFLFLFTWPVLELMPWKLGIAMRYLWIKRLAKSCGENVVFETGVRVTFWEEIEIGDNVAIYENCYIDAKGGVKIGNDVSIAHQASLISFDFDIHDPSVPMKYSAMRKKPIVIGDDCMIFSGARVFAGANIASRSVVAANAVMQEGDHKPGVYAGLPAVWKKAV